MKKKVATMDVTPTWVGILPVLKAAVMDGTFDSRVYVCEELEKLCAAADELNRLNKRREYTMKPFKKFPHLPKYPKYIVISIALISLMFCISIGILSYRCIVKPEPTLNEKLSTLGPGDPFYDDAQRSINEFEQKRAASETA